MHQQKYQQFVGMSKYGYGWEELGILLEVGVLIVISVGYG